jgi:hypothetical protein
VDPHWFQCGSGSSILFHSGSGSREPNKCGSFGSGSSSELKVTLGIRDLLIRIWIHGSVPLTYPDADPGGRKTHGSYGSAFETLVHLHHSSKIKSCKEVTFFHEKYTQNRKQVRRYNILFERQETRFILKFW